MSSRVVEVEAGSLEEAEHQLQIQIPPGFAILSEQIISDGKPKIIQASAETLPAAWEKIQAQVPPGAEIISRQELMPSGVQLLQVEAADEQVARAQASRQLDETKRLLSLRTVVPPRKGLLGMGKSAGQYEAQIAQHAVVQVTYRSNARIHAVFDHEILAEAGLIMNCGLKKGDLRISAQLERLLMKVATSADQFKLLPEETLTWLINYTYFVTSSSFAITSGLTAQLMQVNCRNSRLWSALFEATYGSGGGVENVLNNAGIPALDLMLWYLNTPEGQVVGRVRDKEQLLFLGLAQAHYSKCSPALQAGIAAALKDMILNWKGQLWHVIPRCCKILVSTGDPEALQVAAVGMQRCDAEYTQMLTSLRDPDDPDYNDRLANELQEWREFKQQISQVMKS